MSHLPMIVPHVAALPVVVPFVGPESMERMRGRPFRARIGANESVFGPSPKAVAAMQAAAVDIWKYGDPTNGDLIAAIAAADGIQPENVVVGEGIDGVLAMLIRTSVGVGTPVVTSLGGYPTFDFLVRAAGGHIHTVPYAGDYEDLPGLIRAARAERAPLIYFVNPDNPMGTCWSARDVAAELADLPDETLLIIDEAYAEFAPAGTLLPLDMSRPNIIHVRTFSKAYGMAGARIGYGIGAAGLIAQFEKVRNHYGVNKVAQAGALAAFADRRHLDHVVTSTIAARARIELIARANGLTPIPSGASFVTVDMGRDGPYARGVLTRLIDRDVFIRMPWQPPHDRCIRFGCGTAADLDYVAEILPTVL